MDATFIKIRNQIRNLVERGESEAALCDVMDVLFPEGDADAEWDAETIENVARALHDNGIGPDAPEATPEDPYRAPGDPSRPGG